MPRGFAILGRELAAAFAVIATAIPSCLAAGVLAFAPLGPNYVEAGVAAGLCSAIVAAPAAALVAGTPWLLPTPRSSAAVIQASLLANMWRNQTHADPYVVLSALAICIVTAGLLQVLFGLGGVARLVKFTPHPVLAGFLNGVALLVCLPQIAQYFHLEKSLHFERPFMFALMLVLAAVTMAGRRIEWKAAGAVFGLFVGVAAYHALRAVAPGLELGPTMGAYGNKFLPDMPIVNLPLESVTHDLAPMLPTIFLTAFSLAIVATFDTLMTLRIAQKQAGRAVHPNRDLVAQGIGNCIAGFTGSLACQLSPNVVLTGFRSGGRTIAMPILSGLLLLFLALALKPALAAIPIVVLSAMVLANGIQAFDGWSLRLLVSTLFNRGGDAPRRHAWHDLLVVLVVMGITASGAIIAGVLAGAALACIIFIANMSRPIVRRIHRGNEIASKRVRPAQDTAALLATGSRRAVIELQGVLFFGNADDLADRLTALYGQCDMIALDLHGIADIDISGAQVLHEIVTAARRREKRLLFCAVPPDIARTTSELARGGDPLAPLVLPDLDSAVEWMEEETLSRDAAGRGGVEQLALNELDFTQGLDAEALTLLGERLIERRFAAGEAICVEGDAADRMWLLTKGTVSVRVKVGPRDTVRIASLAMGTVVGEMALLGTGRRSASVVADEDVQAWELEERLFRELLDEHPRIASAILANLAREMARRVRTTSEYLRHALG